MQDKSKSPERQRSLKERAISGRPFEDMNCIIESIGNQGAIYLGNYESASNLYLQRAHQIGAILSLCGQPIPKDIQNGLTCYLAIYAEDRDDFNIAKHFERAFEFIESARLKTNVLIHCYAGISRSATVLIAYIMKKYGLDLKQSIYLVQKKRWQILPNNGFLKQLQDYQKFLFDEKQFKVNESQKNLKLNLFQTYNDNKRAGIDAPLSQRQMQKMLVDKQINYINQSDYQQIRNNYVQGNYDRYSAQNRIRNELTRSVEQQKNRIFDTTQKMNLTKDYHISQSEKQINGVNQQLNTSLKKPYYNPNEQYYQQPRKIEKDYYQTARMNQSDLANRNNRLFTPAPPANIGNYPQYIQSSYQLQRPNINQINPMNYYVSQNYSQNELSKRQLFYF